MGYQPADAPGPEEAGPMAGSAVGAEARWPGERGGPAAPRADASVQTGAPVAGG